MKTYKIPIWFKNSIKILLIGFIVGAIIYPHLNEVRSIKEENDEEIRTENDDHWQYIMTSNEIVHMGDLHYATITSINDTLNSKVYMTLNLDPPYTKSPIKERGSAPNFESIVSFRIVGGALCPENLIKCSFNIKFDDEAFTIYEVQLIKSNNNYSRFNIVDHQKFVNILKKSHKLVVEAPIKLLDKYEIRRYEFNVRDLKWPIQ